MPTRENIHLIARTPWTVSVKSYYYNGLPGWAHTIPLPCGSEPNIGWNNTTKMLVLIACYNADDLLILSEAEKSLQRCLFILELYCNRWKLDVNLDKNKKLKLSF